ncbi:hypothetical protein MN608_09961 [Microdochium nivale]|nr:hypothetical protein MN608_09961 [Microdochium nivale]
MGQYWHKPSPIAAAHRDIQAPPYICTTSLASTYSPSDMSESSPRSHYPTMALLKIALSALAATQVATSVNASPLPLNTTETAPTTAQLHKGQLHLRNDTQPQFPNTVIPEVAAGVYHNYLNSTFANSNITTDAARDDTTPTVGCTYVANIWRQYHVWTREAPADDHVHISICHGIWKGLFARMRCGALLWTSCNTDYATNQLDWKFTVASWCTDHDIEMAWVAGTGNKYGEIHCHEPDISEGA